MILESSDEEVNVEVEPRSDISYSVKLINPVRKSDYRIEKWRTNIRFKSFEQMKSMLKDRFSELKKCQDCRVGYIEPGHGWKGKQRWITGEEDLKDMYRTYSSRREVLIWCFIQDEACTVASNKRKQQCASAPDSKRTKCSTAIEKKMTEAKDIVRLLREKHGEQFSTEQFHAWSQLVQLGKHASHDKPPDYPFFRTSKKKSIHSAESSPSATATTPTKSTAPAVGMSPGRRVNLRTECLQQLKQLGELLENGSISPDQHLKLKEAIMSDIYKF